jgi:type 2 lantibiotic biosynthesis protein LanM
LYLKTLDLCRLHLVRISRFLSGFLTSLFKEYFHMDYLDSDTLRRLTNEPAVPELLAELLAQGRQELQNTLHYHLFTHIRPEVMTDAILWLQQILSHLTNELICQRFTSFRLIMSPLQRRVFATPGDAPPGSPRAILDAYIEWEKAQGLLLASGPYPELAHAIRLAQKNWLFAVVEVLDRVRTHKSKIARLISGYSGPSDELTNITFGISDPHSGGRTAAILHFGDHRVIYKPHNIGSEALWGELATYVVHEALGLDLRTPEIIDLGSFGFVEFVEHEACTTKDAVYQCYQRYGALLCLAHALGTCDLHHENVIVAGEYPVVVDAETIFKARLGLSEKGKRRLEFENQLSLQGIGARESILETGILPATWVFPLFAEEEQYSWQEVHVGALCAYGEMPAMQPVLCGRGSDNLTVQLVPVRTQHFPNLPYLGNELQRASAFLDAINDGFERTHRFLAHSRRELIEAGGILDCRHVSHVRLLPRPTMQYAIVLQRSLSAEVVGSAEARRHRLEADLALLNRGRLDNIEDMKDAEIESLLMCDIPLFNVDARARTVGETPLIGAPLEESKARLSSLDDFDLKLQRVAIQHNLSFQEKESARRDSEGILPGIQSIALDLAESLVAVVQSKDASPFWVYANYAPGLNSTMTHADRESLYEGGAGTAIVVAEAGRISGRDEWCNLAAALFEPIVRGEQLNCVRRGGGLGRGLGGLIYALLRTWQATGKDELLDTAVKLIEEHGVYLAEHDPLDELLHGRAGLLLAALALYHHHPKPSILTVADTAALQLVLRAKVSKYGVYWPVASHMPLALTAHGASGIVMALARWARLRGDSEAIEDIVENALRWDDQSWITDEQGWRDGRLLDAPLTGEDTNWGWCNGRAGMLLVRAAIADALGREFTDEIVSSALHAPITDVLKTASPGLCCGTSGVLDALLELEKRYPTDELQEKVTQATAIIAEKTPRSLLDPLNGSLFGGAAGAAFALLRASSPSLVRSILWFD